VNHASSETSTQAPWIEEPGASRWRKFAASALVGLAVLLGIATVALYFYIVWSDPPDFSHSPWSRELKGQEFFYFFLPIMFAFGPVWAASWLAKRIDPSRSDD
jgi:hypothetical protein